MKKATAGLVLALILHCCPVYGLPSNSVTIDPTTLTWIDSWLSVDWWNTYFGSYSGVPLAPPNIHYDAVLGNYVSENGNWSSAPTKKWNKNKPITVYHKFKVISGSGFNWVFFSGEAEYWGFDSSGTSLGYYYNAAYGPNTFPFSYGQVIETLMEFDGNQTTVLKARILGDSNWTTVKTMIFKPTVHPALQMNQWGASVYRGEVRVTGEEVWEFIDNSDMPYYFPQTTNAAYEWGVEFNDSSDYGVIKYQLLGGGLTILDTPGVGKVWPIGTASNPYRSGTFGASSPFINPAAGYKYSKLELMGALRGGTAGSYLRIYVRKSDGSLVPSSDMGGQANPIEITSSPTQVITVDLSTITYTGIYLEVAGNSATPTDKLWPDYTGTTGPPILKQAAITFVSTGQTQSTTGKYTSTMKCSFR